MKDKDTPLRLVRKWEKMEPGIYSQMDYLRGAKDSGEMSWPDYCELPIGAAYTLLESKHDSRVAAQLCAELTALWTWRRSKKIYWFDQTLAASLAEQAEDVQDTDVLPADVLMHLPYPCIYIKAPGLLEHTDGFFAWIEYDINHDRVELRIQWMFEDMECTFAQMLHILPGKTIKDCILDTVQTSQENIGEDIKLQDAGVSIARIILSAVQLVLYLASSNAEVEPEQPPLVPKKGPREKKVVRLERKPNDDKASSIDAFSVGVRIGAALRNAARTSRTSYSGSGESGGTKRSHTRRGHWHHYWTGPKAGDRKLILKWTAPTVIHPENAEDNIIVYPVKE